MAVHTCKISKVQVFVILCPPSAGWWEAVFLGVLKMDNGFMRHHLTFALAIALVGPASAGSTIDPVIVALDGGRGTVSITNVTEASTGYEVRALDWSVADDGRDSLTPTDNLVVFPPLFRLAPGQTLTLRLREAVLPSAVENAYRLEITEEPPEVTGNGVGIQMQYLTSAFSGLEGATASLICHVETAGTLRIENNGSTRARIDGVLANGVDITADVEFTGRTVLAQAARLVSLPSNVDASDVEIDARGVPSVRCQ